MTYKGPERRSGKETLRFSLPTHGLSSFVDYRRTRTQKPFKTEKELQVFLDEIDKSSIFKQVPELRAAAIHKFMYGDKS